RAPTVHCEPYGGVGGGQLHRLRCRAGRLRCRAGRRGPRRWHRRNARRRAVRAAPGGERRGDDDRGRPRRSHLLVTFTLPSSTAAETRNLPGATLRPWYGTGTTVTVMSSCLRVRRTCSVTGRRTPEPVPG